MKTATNLRPSHDELVTQSGKTSEYRFNYKTPLGQLKRHCRTCKGVGTTQEPYEEAKPCTECFEKRKIFLAGVAAASNLVLSVHEEYVKILDQLTNNDQSKAFHELWNAASDRAICAREIYEKILNIKTNKFSSY